MLARNSSLAEIKAFVKESINRLYETDGFLFTRNNGNGVCERAIVFRFAHYLQNATADYYVDCDFNSSFEGYVNLAGSVIGQERHGKPIENEDGTATKRFVDVIVHKRDFSTLNDFICFEIKKWNNTNSNDFKKDKNNLRVLTSKYGYVFGFHISFHREKENSKWTIFRAGTIFEQESRIFKNQTEY